MFNVSFSSHYGKVALNPKYSELHEKLEEKLNELGKEGWRLCGVNGCFYYFAREI